MQSHELEALLFVAGDDGLTESQIQQVYGIDASVIQGLVHELESICQSSSRPYTVHVVRQKISLVTKPAFGSIIARMRSNVERQPLSRPQMEILSFLAYGGPSSKVNIDTYRGVNSVQPLRALSLRGMIERVGESHGSYVYALTDDALRGLGVTSREQLPNYTELHAQLTLTTT